MHPLARHEHDIQQFIEMCNVWRTYDKRQPKEMLISNVPDTPLTKVGIDQFSYRSHYLVYVDYYSSLWEVDHLEDMRSATVIQKLKAQLTRNGINETGVSERLR